MGRGAVGSPITALVVQEGLEGSFEVGRGRDVPQVNEWTSLDFGG